MTKKEIRIKLKNEVLKRDKNKCRKCDKSNVILDAHHITDRKEMPNGGYVKENLISLCTTCHLRAENFHASKGFFCMSGYHPDDLYKLINSSYKLAYKKSEELCLKN